MHLHWMICYNKKSMVTKKVVQDIIPSSRRSIRLVPLARTEKKEKERQQTHRR